jgi:hypothetical protein
MVIPEVLLERVIIDVILLLPASVSSVTYVASFMLISTMRVELIITVEPPSTKPTLRMTPETTLVNCAWVIITELLVIAQFLGIEQLMLVGEHLLVPCAQITHDLMMHTLHMAMEVWPSPASDITVLVRTVVAEQKNSIIVDLFVLVFDTQYVVNLLEVAVNKILVSLDWVVRKNYKLRLRLDWN